MRELQKQQEKEEEQKKHQNFADLNIKIGAFSNFDYDQFKKFRLQENISMDEFDGKRPDIDQLLSFV